MSVSNDKQLIFSARRKDFELTWFSGTGSGGQHRNKHQNCCRIKHIETGFLETGQNHRERQRNLSEAFKKLAKRLVDHYVKQEHKQRYKNTEVVRTYNQPDNIVRDHLSGFEQTYMHVVDKGNIDQMLEERLKHATSKV